VPFSATGSIEGISQLILFEKLFTIKPEHCWLQLHLLF